MTDNLSYNHRKRHGPLADAIADVPEQFKKSAASVIQVQLAIDEIERSKEQPIGHAEQSLSRLNPEQNRYVAGVPAVTQLSLIFRNRHQTQDSGTLTSISQGDYRVAYYERHRQIEQQAPLIIRQLLLHWTDVEEEDILHHAERQYRRAELEKSGGFAATSLEMGDERPARVCSYRSSIRPRYNPTTPDANDHRGICDSSSDVSVRPASRVSRIPGDSEKNSRSYDEQEDPEGNSNGERRRASTAEPDSRPQRASRWSKDRQPESDSDEKLPADSRMLEPPPHLRLGNVHPCGKTPVPVSTGVPVEINGILKFPTDMFPENPYIGIPPYWTKLDRRLVSPSALEGQEPFEKQKDHVVIIRVLTKEEILAYALKTAEIRR